MFIHIFKPYQHVSRRRKIKVPCFLSRWRQLRQEVDRLQQLLFASVTPAEPPPPAGVRSHESSHTAATSAVTNITILSSLRRYLKFTLDQYVEMDYILVYFHYGLRSSNKPSLKWLREAYSEFDRKYDTTDCSVHFNHVLGEYWILIGCRNNGHIFTSKSNLYIWSIFWHEEWKTSFIKSQICELRLQLTTIFIMINLIFMINRQ